MEAGGSAITFHEVVSTSNPSKPLVGRGASSQAALGGPAGGEGYGGEAGSKPVFCFGQFSITYRPRNLSREIIPSTAIE